MSLLVCGLNHRTASLALREQCALTEEMGQVLLHRLHRLSPANECVYLSTCHRIELYMSGIERSVAEHMWAEMCGVDVSALQACTYSYEEAAGVQHLMRLASGLDSVVLGEPQVAGQLRQAFQAAQSAGGVGDHFQGLFSAVFETSKLVRHSTDVGRHPVSFAYAVLDIAKKLFENISQCRVLLIGCGEMNELIGRHMHSQGVTQIQVVNRHRERAEEVAISFQASVIGYEDLPTALPQADIVIAATASPIPVVGKGLVETAVKKRVRPLLMIDLAVPRDIETEVAHLDPVFLYHIDDLTSVIETNLAHRQEAAVEAEALVKAQVEHYEKSMRVREISTLIARFRAVGEAARDRELKRAMKRVQQGEEVDAVLMELAYRLTNAIMHVPTVRLREAAYRGYLNELQLLFEEEWV